tara:strand:- start:18 stop:179 length:162 start_codon:yes stop_codon:yes gene_type:complete
MEGYKLYQPSFKSNFTKYARNNNWIIKIAQRRKRVVLLYDSNTFNDSLAWIIN